MRKIKLKKLYTVLVFLMIWVYFSLNSVYLSIPGAPLFRWCFPIFLLLFATIESGGKIPIPPLIFSFFSIAVIPSIIMSNYKIEALVKYFSWILILYGSYIFLVNIKDKEYQKYCFRILCTVLIIYQLLNFIFVVSGLNSDAGRARGITANANTLGVYSNLAYWAVVYMILYTKKKIVKIAGRVLLVMAGTTALASGSRTAFIVLMLNIFITIIIRFKKSPFFIFYMGAVILMAYLLLSGAFESLHITALERLQAEGGTDRGELWEAAILLWKQHPIFGVGYTVSYKYNLTEPGMAFHNSYLSFLVECGNWGAVMLGSGMLLLIKKIIKTTSFKIDGKEHIEYFIVLVMEVNLIVAAWSESFMFAVGSTEGFVLWFLVAWILAYMKLKKNIAKTI